MTTLHDLLQQFAAAEIESWQGLPAGLSLGDVRVGLRLEGGATGEGFLGEDRRPAQWSSAASAVFRGGLRVWHDEGAVILLEGRDPFDGAGTPLAAPDLGEPGATLDTVLGRLTLAGGEHVHAARGLALRVNDENGILLGAIGFVASTADEYRTRLRPDVEQPRLLPNPATHGSLR